MKLDQLIDHLQAARRVAGHGDIDVWIGHKEGGGVPADALELWPTEDPEKFTVIVDSDGATSSQGDYPLSGAVDFLTPGPPKVVPVPTWYAGHEEDCLPYSEAEARAMLPVARRRAAENKRRQIEEWEENTGEN